MSHFLSPKIILQQHNLHPNKLLGQNFLLDEGALNDLAAAAELAPTDTALEVGGGVGTVTRALARRAGRIVSVEKDKHLVPILREQTKDMPNVDVVEGDILEISNIKSQISNLRNYKLVGTPPYYLTARLFRTFLEEASVRPSLIVLIIQKEVAEKICAKPPRTNMLALSVQIFGEPKIIREISHSAFWPEPEVDSALLAVRVYPEPLVGEMRIKTFFRIAKAAFAHPRQQLQKTLAGGLDIPREETMRALSSAGINTHRRPETLSIQEWQSLLRVLTPLFL